MQYELLGAPGDGPKLALDYRAFSYAGKFVTANTGKAVALAPPGESVPAPLQSGPPPADVDGAVDPDGTVLGAAAFNEDRTDPDACWVRYVTVRDDRRGEGIGSRLLAFTVARLRERGYDRVRIAVNNPVAYQAAYRAGFASTGEETGVAELVLAAPAADRSREAYRAGLDVFRERDLDGDQRAFLAERRDADPPPVVDPPESGTD